MGSIDKPKALESPKIRFESSTMMLTNVAALGVAVGATVLAVRANVLAVDVTVVVDIIYN